MLLYDCKETITIVVTHRQWMLYPVVNITSGLSLMSDKVGQQWKKAFSTRRFFNNSYLQVRNQPIRYGLTAGVGEIIGSGLFYTAAQATATGNNLLYRDFLQSKARKYDWNQD